jgi:predicted O-linked N-acetylglucosamine transferase (SPINDLY family)
VNFWPGQDARSICEELARWNRQHTQPLAKFIGPHSNDRSPGRRLRVGYVSPCFWDHCQAFFLMPLLSAHDRSQVEVVCYSDAGKRDAVTDRLRGHADLWREVRGLTDEQLCSLVREDRIDILVDLNMHMAQSRLQAFARKPAPVQVCWLAYPGTTGLPAIDYRLTDPHLDPPGLNDRFYSEQSIRLRDSFWCYDPLTVEPSVSPLPALTNGLVTFGCLNTFRKVNDDVLELWARAMGRVGRSRLVLLAPQGNCRQHVLDVFKAKGVSPDRVLFQDRQSRLGYLESYKQIDIGLDTFPYNGHTTSLDSFWMGVPVITIVGSTVVGRAGLSQLMNLGLPELIAHTPEEFVKIAAQLASDLPHLSELRAGLRDRMQRSPLMDAPRFARSMEAAYRDMWHRWCSK